MRAAVTSSVQRHGSGAYRAGRKRGERDDRALNASFLALRGRRVLCGSFPVAVDPITLRVVRELLASARERPGLTAIGAINHTVSWTVAFAA